MPQKRAILAVDDEADILRLLRRALEGEGYDVREASTGRGALKSLKESPPDLVLLDMGLPDLHGLEVCAAIKGEPKISRVPIVVLTGEKQAGFNVTCLDHGADDFLTKPCNMRELLARIQAVLRRSYSPDPKKKPVLELKNFKIDLARRAVLAPGVTIENFTPKEFDILCLLVEKSPETLSREFLAEKVWGPEESFQSRTIDVHVRRIRLKLGEPLAERLQTVSGAGYKFQ